MKVSIKTLLKTTVITLIVVAVAVPLGILADNLKRRNNELEGIYQRAYYETISSLNDIELNLSKLQATSDPTIERGILTQLWGDSEVVETNFSTLMNGTPDNSSIISFINKLGDYSKALSKTESMTQKDKETMAKMYLAVVELKGILEGVQDEIIEGNTLLSSVGQRLNYVSEKFDSISHASIAVPQLIYDGPFSDGLNDKETKWLTDMQEVTEEKAKKTVEELFGEATLTGTIEEGIPSYIFTLIGYQDSEIRVTKRGGKVYSFNRYLSVEDSTLSDQEYMDKGVAFLERLGYYDMEPVWISNNNSTVYVNYAYKKDGVVCYPDIIIVKMTADTADVVGMEGQNYVYNHVERSFAEPALEEVARAVLSPNLTVVSSRLALIPTEWNTEILTYEYVTTLGTDTYYVYVDAVSPKEVKMLKVIDDDGTLVA